MVNASSSDADRSAVSLELELEGRRFPVRTGLVGRSPVPVHRIAARDEDQVIASQLSRDVADSLPWFRLSVSETDRQTLVTTYIRSLERILEYRREAEAFVKLACEANLEFRQTSAQLVTQARDDVLQERFGELCRQAVADWAPVRNILDAHRVSQDVGQLRGQLQDDIQATTDDFGRQFLGLLARLVDANVFGLVEWLPNQCCAYHFFKQVVIQTDSQFTTTTRTERLADRPNVDFTSDDPSNGSELGGTDRITTTETTTAAHLHRLSRHEHSVMNSIRTTIGNSKVVMPPNVAKLVSRVPQWLYPHVRIIDGDLFRERIVEQDLREQQWTDARVTVRDVPVYGLEPAVVIGPYVLSGWGPREITDEQQRLAIARELDDRQRQAAHAASHLPVQCGLAVALGVLSVVVAAIMAEKGSGAVIWLAATLGCVFLIGKVSFALAVPRRFARPGWFAALQTTSIVSGVLLVQWAVARCFTPLTWITPVVLLVVMVSSESIRGEYLSTKEIS